MSFFTTVVPSQLVSPEELKIFYSIDRSLYTLLINELGRDPLVSIRIMGLWLWLEKSGFKSIINKAFSLPIFLINELANEAVLCLKLIDNNDGERNPSLSLSEPVDLSLTKSLVYKEISAMYFQENRVLIVQEMSKVIKNVCVKVMNDIMEEAMERNLIQYMNLMGMRSQLPPTTSSTSSSSSAGFLVVNPNYVGAQVRGQGREVLHPDERTMFVTFSKGYPVAEREIREFLTRIYGDCIESLYMQEVVHGEQALFARTVFYLPGVIDMILNGADKAKFTINGKHMWMRKFVSKRHMSPNDPSSSFLASTSSVPWGPNNMALYTMQPRLFFGASSRLNFQV